MVDNISKPFTFVANTYAKASEVNADFDALYTGANACINQVNTNITSINTLDSNKANKNGSSQEVFKVKNPENDLDAVNRQSMIKAMGNSIDYISGFTITKSQTSPNDTIVVSPGSCYDDTRKILLSTTTSITKQNENQGASTTYYVYATSVNSTGIPTDITISQSSVSPGTTLFRKIGSFDTDSNGYIYKISEYSNGVTLGSVANSNMVPDYANATTRSVNTTYTAPSNGYVHVYAHTTTLISTPRVMINLSINGSTYWYTEHYGNGTGSYDSCIVPVKMGDTFKQASVSGNTYTIHFIPCVGG